MTAPSSGDQAGAGDGYLGEGGRGVAMLAGEVIYCSQILPSPHHLTPWRWGTLLAGLTESGQAFPAPSGGLKAHRFRYPEQDYGQAQGLWKEFLSL